MSGASFLARHIRNAMRFLLLLTFNQDSFRLSDFLFTFLFFFNKFSDNIASLAHLIALRSHTDRLTLGKWLILLEAFL